MLCFFLILLRYSESIIAGVRIETICRTGNPYSIIIARSLSRRDFPFVRPWTVSPNSYLRGKNANNWPALKKFNFYIVSWILCVCPSDYLSCSYLPDLTSIGWCDGEALSRDLFGKKTECQNAGYSDDYDDWKFFFHGILLWQGKIIGEK